MPFNTSQVERLSQTPDEPNRESITRAIDLSTRDENHHEEALNMEEKNDAMRSLADIAQARTQLISTLFENGTKTQNAKLAVELIEEARYWSEDLEKQIEFIQEYREETGDETAFSATATKTIKTLNALKSELDHMLEVVRIWHEDEFGESSISEHVSEDTEGTFDQVTDAELIETPKAQAEPAPIDEEEPATLRIVRQKPDEAEVNQGAVTQRILTHQIIDATKHTPHPAFTMEAANDHSDEVIDLKASLPTTEAVELVETPGSLEDTRNRCLAVSQTIQQIQESLSRTPTFADRELFDNYLLNLSHEYADFVDRLEALKKSPVQGDQIMEEMGLLEPTIKNIKNIRHRLHQTKLPEAPPFLIEIPGGLEETREKCTAVHRMVGEIRKKLSRNLSKENQEQFAEYQMILSREYTAFEERLDMLNRVPIQTEDVMEEKSLIGTALEEIQDARDHIHQLNLLIPSEQQLDVQLELKDAKKKQLERIAKRLTDAIERGGIEHPELYMTEQASGLGSIRRGLMSLFGRKEQTVNKATLTKLRNEAIQAEKTYFDSAYNERDQVLPIYQKAIARNPVLQLTETSDIHDLWQALHQEIDELGGQLESHLIPGVQEGVGEAKVNVARAKAFEESTEGRTLHAAKRRDQGHAENYRINELETIKSSGLIDALELYKAIKADSQAEHLTFLPADYLGAIADLKNANSRKDVSLIKKLLPRARSMKDEMNDSWMDLTNEGGEPFSDEEVLNRARILIGLEADKKKKPTKKK